LTVIWSTQSARHLRLGSKSACGLADSNLDLSPYKRAVDAAEFRTALYAGLDVVGPLYATTTELGARFRQIATTEGVPAAVRWRSAQFKE
jgi:hypothetical protein